MNLAHSFTDIYILQVWSYRQKKWEYSNEKETLQHYYIRCPVQKHYHILFIIFIDYLLPILLITYYLQINLPY
jgi:hypothetical protein